MPSKKVVGLEDEAEKIEGYLNERTRYLDVISIIGMPGLGKTTLAGKIYNDPNIRYGFPTRIWAYISQEFKKKEVFLSISEIDDDAAQRGSLCQKECRTAC